RFMELVKAPRSRLGRYIQRIYIEGPEDSLTDAPSQHYSYLISDLQEVLPCLTNVSEIEMVSITWNIIPHEVKIQMENLTKVKTLSWCLVRVDRLDQLLVFSAGFPRLQTLRIDELRVKAASSYQSLSYSYPNQFASLRALSLFVEKSTMPLLSALSSNVVFPVGNIDTLDLWIRCWDTLAYSLETLGYLDSILKDIGPTLRVLRLRINIFDSLLDDPGFELLPSLRQMVNLKSLQFMRWVSSSRDLMWIRNILRTMSFVGYSLESIHFGFWMVDNSNHLALLEQEILELKTTNIRVIVERLERSRWEPLDMELLKILKVSFPELSRRGQIHLVGWD
ncbi:hypothetical protein C0992_011874, partial [Termitomyces sp. T32_za158]